MITERHVVDNRVFLLGLDSLYRGVMKCQERTRLLDCARKVAGELSVRPASVAVEGYYAEDKWLEEYFLLIRALQRVDDGRRSRVDQMPEYRRLLDVMSSGLFGSPVFDGMLLPVGRDPLAEALIQTYRQPDLGGAWNMENLCATACDLACSGDDFSIAGLAARSRDALALAAVRESAVLYEEEILLGCACDDGPEPEYIWQVDPGLAEYARRFVDTFNGLFKESLPQPDPAQAERYWKACDEYSLPGRCVKLAGDAATSPIRYYHWAICRADDGAMRVHEFWDTAIWTTQRFSRSLQHGKCPPG